MYYVPRAYEGYWAQSSVIDVFRQLTMPDIVSSKLEKKFWFTGHAHSTMAKIAHDWTLKESRYLIDPYTYEEAEPIDLMKYDSKDIILVKSKQDVDLVDELHMAPAPVWSVERRHNYQDSDLMTYDYHHMFYAFHIQTVRSATFSVKDQFYITVKREDDDSFRFVSRLYGKEDTNKVYREMMAMST